MILVVGSEEEPALCSTESVVTLTLDAGVEHVVGLEPLVVAPELLDALMESAVQSGIVVEDHR